MTGSTHKIYRIDCLTSADELLRLKADYIAFTRRIVDVPIFLDWHWIITWLRFYNRRLSPWVLVAREESGQIAGIAPWMVVTQRWGPLRLRQVNFIGAGDIFPCHLTVLVDENQRAQISNDFLSYLNSHQRQWDVVDLDSAASACAFRQNIGAACGRVFEKRSFNCHFISLPDSWQSYHKSLSKKLRRNLRYYHRRLQRENTGAIAFHRITAEAELKGAMDGLIAMHHKRWHLKGQVSAFDERRFEGFHREMSRVALERGWLRFFQLKVDDQVIAALYAFRYRDVFYVYQMGFDPSWGRYSPGRLLTAHVIQAAIKEGARVFDWLRGEQQFKRAWANNMHVNYRLLLSNNLRGHLLINSKSYRHFAKSFWQNFFNIRVYGRR